MPFSVLSPVQGDINDKLPPPEGWIIADDEPAGLPVAEDTKEFEARVFRHLPYAAQSAEQLVKAIHEKTNILVPETYMRVETNATFHVLLLVSRDDFHVPQMAVARLLADERTKEETRFDIHFSFSIWTDFEQNRAIVPGNYRLKHMNSGRTGK